ncbi:MAG: hypothetical protein DMF61_21145 [Blastocatellia bacterium AA13]|nr:MAG: hypothetical protein DMF61_21145 [Blastocatellia bacterium AA13]
MATKTKYLLPIIAALTLIATTTLPVSAYSGGPQRSDSRGRQSYGRNSLADRLTGTYQIDSSRSEDVVETARRATRGLSPEETDRLQRVISRRLDAPDTLALEGHGRSLTIASSRAPQVTFEADGRTRTEQTPRGRTINVTASLNGGRLVVSTAGERGANYTVTFDSVENGRGLRVTRRLDIESIDHPVSVTTFYTKTDDVARLDLFQNAAPVLGNPDQGMRSFAVPDGARLVASLDNALSTRAAGEGDRFTMTVRSPSQFEGDVLEGYVSRTERPGRATGRAELTLNFERIRLHNGGTREFSGYIEGVRPSNGEDVRVDNEGNLSDRDSQTGRTVGRTGIGAALGAVIGAIAGGGKGAAIGAAVGAGAGAGSVFIQGRDNLDLSPGTEFTVRAISPGYRDESRR